jgi:hypothetical protein
MAIWQFKVELIPAVTAQCKAISLQEWDEQAWWSILQPSRELLLELASLLPTQESWASELSQWGRQDSDLIEVWSESGKVESISARFDCRKVNFQFIRQLLDLSNKWQCSIVYARDRTVQPHSYSAFLESIFASPSYKVVSNPDEWLPKMAKEVKNAEKS